MYRTPLTSLLFQHFSSCYPDQLPSSARSNDSSAFVYVDSEGFKFLTSVVESKDQGSDGIFAISMAEDGWMEMLAMYENV